MLYHVLGKQIEIEAMKKPAGGHGSIFEFTGDGAALKSIGLEETFFYSTAFNGRYSNELSIYTDTCDLCEARNEYQRVLSYFLYKSIYNGELTDQFAPPMI